MATNLPTELWRLIIRQATYILNLLSVTWNHSPCGQIWEGWDTGANTAIDMGLETKYAVVQVCREWRDIGIEFLYEAIPLPWYNFTLGSAQIDDLIEVFVASTAAAPSGRGHGWWTKRVVCPHRFLCSKHVEKLFSLLDQCRNIAIFTILGYDETVPLEIQNRLVRSLGSRFSHSLRRVEVCMRAGDQPCPDVIPLVFGLTSLTLRVLDSTPNPPDYSVFEHITTLTIHFPAYVHNFPPQWNFPSLRNLSLRGVSVRDTTTLIPFVERHQETLLHLHISTTRTKNYEIHSLLSSASKLRSLAFDVRDLHVLEESNIVLTSLTHLGLAHAQKKDGYTEWSRESLKKTLESGLFPSLQVIRLLREMDPTPPYSILRAMTERCSEHGVMFEDQNGKLICGF